MNDRDREMFQWVRAFNRYDLYSKGDGKPDADGPAAVLRGSARGIFSRSDSLVKITSVESFLLSCPLP